MAINKTDLQTKTIPWFSRYWTTEQPKCFRLKAEIPIPPFSLDLTKRHPKINPVLRIENDIF